MSINWTNIIETITPLIIMAILGGLGTIIYRNRKDLFLWLKRVKLTILPVKFNVALSLDFNEGLNSGTYYKEIRKSFFKNIEDNDLSKTIVIRDFSDIKKFESITEAENFRNKKQIDLIIWGGFSGDGLKKDGEEVHNIDLKFTYGHPDDEGKRIGAMLLADISSKFAIKNYWQILENSSFTDLSIINNNVFDLAAYILGTTLKLSGRIGISLKIFESLLNKLILQNDSFSQYVIPHVLNCYEIFIMEFGVRRKNLKLGLEFCHKHLKLHPDNFFGLSNLAIFQFFLGMEKEAEENVEKLLKLYPNRPVTEVDVAFFRILQKDYNNAYKHYQKIISFTRIDFNAQEVIEFLFNQYELKKDPALLYGAGILSFYFGDQDLARTTFLEFLANSSENFCKKMYRNAKRLAE